jgi:hypothetical protein
MLSARLVTGTNDGELDTQGKSNSDPQLLVAYLFGLIRTDKYLHNPKHLFATC